MSDLTLNPNTRTKVSIDFHGAPYTLETGWWAKQAGGAVIVTRGETMVMATVCGGAARPGIDFFPLVVDYQEKLYAGGKIPGGYLKREGRPSEYEILVWLN
jgi:polyribonucleotide nucleotidyltransferase